jgi:hypothetical protein
LLVSGRHRGSRHAELGRQRSRRHKPGACGKRAFFYLLAQPGVDTAFRAACGCFWSGRQLAHGKTSKLALFIVQVLIEIMGCHHCE